MIFLAVTMGFFAESYREYSVEKSSAKEYARSLVGDLKKDTAMVGIDIAQINIIRSEIDSLSAFLKGKKINDLNNAEVFVYTQENCEYRPYTWSRATLDEIKSSGSLRYFSNDSIVMRISAYDALTKHMDEDFIGDEQRSDKLTEKRNRIVDLNYSLSYRGFTWRTNPDSIRRIILREINNGQPHLQLLTDNINDIKSLLNDYLQIKGQLNSRGKHELPNPVQDASELIMGLRKEYHLKDE